MRGFTLIEMMVVVAIVGVGTALAAPSITDLTRRHRENEAIEKISEFIKSARNDARLKRRCVKVSVSLGVVKKERFTCSDFKRFGGSTPIYGPLEKSKTLKVDLSIKVENPSEPLVFHPYGGSIAEGDVTIAIQSQKTNAQILKLRVFPGIGTLRKDRS